MIAIALFVVLFILNLSCLNFTQHRLLAVGD